MSGPNPPRRCLVTGGNGFIGVYLNELLAARGYEIVICDRTSLADSLSDLDNVHFVQGELVTLLADRAFLRNIDTVFHLAWAHIPESATQNPVADIQDNLVMTVRLLQACVEQSVRRIVFPSTGGAIYGPVKQLPVPETHPTRPISAYGVTKLAAEKYIELYHYLHGLEYAILRPSVPYGPGQDPFGRQGAVAVFMGNILVGQPISIWGDGDTIVRDFFHVSDLARACVAVMEHPAPANVYNIGGGQAVSLNQLVDYLNQVVDPDHGFDVRYAPVRPFDVPRLVLDISRAHQELGWQPEIDLMAGLTDTWLWYKDVWKKY